MLHFLYEIALFLYLCCMKKELEKWKTIHSEYIIKRPWLTARRDEVELPNGVRNPEYYVLEYPDWVNVIAITKEGKFVMVRQYRHGLDDVFTELCAGVMEKGETPEQAARRELLEETGFGSGNWRLWMVVSANPSSMNNLTYCFLATDVEKVSSQHLDKTEDLRYLLYDYNGVKGMLERGDMKQALMVAPLWKYLYSRDYKINME